MAMREMLHKMRKEVELGYFAPKTWPFWRCLVVCFCIFTIAGHWLEIPYCMFMDHCFDIVADDYAVWTDPWYHPYWVYGVGVMFMTFIIEPLKEHIVARRKTLVSAILETFVLAVLVSMVLELVIGFIVNQPDEMGEYPFWDNSQLPLNVLGQAWLVNDVVIGVMAMLYVWVFYPLIAWTLNRIGPRAANIAFAVVVVVFLGCCTASYAELIMNGTLG